jgi:hypothetical protein
VARAARGNNPMINTGAAGRGGRRRTGARPPAADRPRPGHRCDARRRPARPAARRRAADPRRRPAPSRAARGRRRRPGGRQLHAVPAAGRRRQHGARGHDRRHGAGPAQHRHLHPPPRRRREPQPGAGRRPGRADLHRRGHRCRPPVLHRVPGACTRPTASWSGCSTSGCHWTPSPAEAGSCSGPAPSRLPPRACEGWEGRGPLTSGGGQGGPSTRTAPARSPRRPGRTARAGCGCARPRRRTPGRPRRRRSRW